MDVKGRGRRRGAATAIGALAAAVLGFAPGLAGAAVPAFAVTTTGDPAGAGACDAGGACSLRQALAASEAAGGTIALPAGLYQLQLGALEVDAAIANPITVTGAGAATTTIEQTGADRVLDLVGGLVEISGVTITGGDLRGADAADGRDAEGSTPARNADPGAGVEGGGIRNAGALTLTDVVVTGNRIEGGTGGRGGDDDREPADPVGAGGTGGPARGGAIVNSDRLTLVRTVVSGNVAQGGRAGRSGTGPHVLGGYGGGHGGLAYGGGIDNRGELSLVDSTVRDNEALGGEGGAALASWPGTGGRAYGGGIHSAGTTAGIIRSTVSGNLAHGGLPAGGALASEAEGGGLRVSHRFSVRDSTVAGNSAIAGTATGVRGWTDPARGGGVWTNAAGAFEQVTIVRNSAHMGDPAWIDGGSGGNIWADAAVEHRGVLVADGVAGPGKANCGKRKEIPDSYPVGIPSIPRGGNVEQAEPGGVSSCRFELTVADARLAPLAANGGLTETVALLSGSPAIGTGSCVDLAGAAVTHDQRGQARPAAGCDAGAFQHVPAPVVPDPPRRDAPRTDGPRTGAPARAPRLGGVAIVRRAGSTTLRFTLDRAARVTVVYRTAPSGRRRARKVATVTVRGRRGVNRVRLTRRVGRRLLAPGRYRLTIKAGSGRAASRPKTVTLTIPRRAGR